MRTDVAHVPDRTVAVHASIRNTIFKDFADFGELGQRFADVPGSIGGCNDE